jgi:hypothetical protein
VAYLAAYPGALPEAIDELARLWSQLTVDQVFHVGALSLGRNVLRWRARLMSGGAPGAPKVRGLLDTAPLRALLEQGLASNDGEIVGIAKNLERGSLKAIALTTINFSTGQTVTWVQGSEILDWERPLRRSVDAPRIRPALYSRRDPAPGGAEAAPEARVHPPGGVPAHRGLRGTDSPDEVLLKYDDAARSGLFSAFSVVTPTYFSQKQVDPWVVGQVDGAELYAVIAQWDEEATA